MDSETTTSATLKLSTHGEFHEVELVGKFATTGKPDRDGSEVTESVTEATYACLTLRHPNGELDCVYQYVDNVFHTESSNVFGADVGETLWAAKWGDAVDEGIGVTEWDYALITDEQDPCEYPITHPTTLHVTRRLGVDAVAALSVFEAAGLFHVGATVLGMVLTAISTPALGVAAHLRRSSPDRERLPAAVDRLSETETLVEDSDGEVVGEIARRAEAFATWGDATVREVDVDSGRLRCDSDSGVSLTLEFESPQSWSREYGLVKLAEELGVGAVEHLVGERVSVVRNTNRVDGDDTSVACASGNYLVEPAEGT